MSHLKQEASSQLKPSFHIVYPDFQKSRQSQQMQLSLTGFDWPHPEISQFLGVGSFCWFVCLVLCEPNTTCLSVKLSPGDASLLSLGYMPRWILVGRMRGWLAGRCPYKTKGWAESLCRRTSIFFWKAIPWTFIQSSHQPYEIKQVNSITCMGKLRLRECPLSQTTN